MSVRCAPSSTVRAVASTGVAWCSLPFLPIHDTPNLYFFPNVSAVPPVFTGSAFRFYLKSAPESDVVFPVVSEIMDATFRALGFEVKESLESSLEVLMLLLDYLEIEEFDLLIFRA